MLPRRVARQPLEAWLVVEGVRVPVSITSTEEHNGRHLWTVDTPPGLFGAGVRAEVDVPPGNHRALLVVEFEPERTEAPV